MSCQFEACLSEINPVFLADTVELTANEYVEVFVTLINNPISFYLQLVGDGYSVRCYQLTRAVLCHHCVYVCRISCSK